MRILTRIWSKLVTKLTGKPLGKIKKKWVFKTKSAISSSAKISDIDNDGHKEIIFGTDDGLVHVLSDNGKFKWEGSLKQEVDKVKSIFLEERSANSILATPVVTKCKGKKIIIVCSVSGLVKAFYGDGAFCWKFKSGGSILGTPLCADIDDDGHNEIIFGTTDHHLYALNNRGKLLWKFDAKSIITSPPAYYDDKPQLIIFGTEHGFVKAVSKNGKFRWKFKTNEKVTAKPVVSDIFNDKHKYIIVGSNDKSLYLLDKFGKLKWEYKTHGEIFSQVAIGDVDKDNDKEIFFGAGDDIVYALAPNSQKIWSYETDFWVVASPLLVDIDNDGSIEIVVGSYDKSLYILEGKGTFALNYMPGLSIIANQPGHFTPFITSHPGELVGNKLWKVKLSSMITGLSLFDDQTMKKQIIVSTKGGKLYSFHHEK